MAGVEGLGVTMMDDWLLGVSEKVMVVVGSGVGVGVKLGLEVVVGSGSGSTTGGVDECRGQSGTSGLHSVMVEVWVTVEVRVVVPVMISASLATTPAMAAAKARKLEVKRILRDGFGRECWTVYEEVISMRDQRRRMGYCCLSVVLDEFDLAVLAMSEEKDR